MWLPACAGGVVPLTHGTSRSVDRFLSAFSRAGSRPPAPRVAATLPMTAAHPARRGRPPPSGYGSGVRALTRPRARRAGGRRPRGDRPTRPKMSASPEGSRPRHPRGGLCSKIRVSAITAPHALGGGSLVCPTNAGLLISVRGRTHPPPSGARSQPDSHRRTLNSPGSAIALIKGERCGARGFRLPGPGRRVEFRRAAGLRSGAENGPGLLPIREEKSVSQQSARRPLHVPRSARPDPRGPVGLAVPADLGSG